MEGKQIMKVEKFVQEVRELYTAKANHVRFKLGDAMSPRVIIKRLSPRTIEQYTRRCRNRVRSGSLSEVDEFSASSYDTSEDEAEAAVTQTPDVQTPSQFYRLSEEQAKEKSQGEFNKEYDTDPHEGLLSTSFGKDVQSDDDDSDNEDDDISDVLDSDYNGELPDLTDPSWESPIKTGNHKKSLGKKSHIKKHQRVEDNFKKRKDPILMKSARKAFEHQRKIFRSTKKYEERSKDVKESNSSKLSSHKSETSKPEQPGAQLEIWGQQLSNQLPNSVVSQYTGALLKEASIHDGSMTPSVSNSSLNSKKEKIRQLVKANMYKTLMNPLILTSEKYSFPQCQPQIVGSDLQSSKEGMPLIQDSSQSESRLVTSLNSPEPLSSGDPKDTGTVDMSEAGQESITYDSDETVNFDESVVTLRNLVTSHKDVLVNSNNNVVKRINEGKSVIDCATNSNSRKRQSLENVDENCGEARKRIKQEESEKPKGTKVHVPMVIIPTTTIETMVSVTPVSISSVTNVTTATTDHIPLHGHSVGSLEVAEKASDIHAARGAKEKEIPSCTSIGKQGMKEVTSVPIEGPALILKRQLTDQTNSLELNEKDKRLPLASASEGELSATREKNINLELTEKGSPVKPICSIKELLNVIMELSNKRTQCEEKIKKIKEDCNKRIEMVEAEKKEYEKEMEKMVSVMQNWRESSPDKSEVNANHESTHNATAKDTLVTGTSQKSTADSAQKISSESTNQTPTSNVDEDLLAVHTSQEQSSNLVSPDTGSNEVQLFTKKKQVLHGASPHKYRKGTSMKTITLTDVDASTLEKRSSTQKQKKLTINVISAANINRFGKASTSPAKRKPKKSPPKRKAGTSSASQIVPISSTPSDQHLGELRSQTSRSNTGGTTAVASSGSVLLPQAQPTTQVQSGTSFLWPQGTVPGPQQVCPNVVVTSLMQNVQQQPTRLQVIRPVLPPQFPPPSYQEHLRTLRAVAPSVNQQFKVVQQGTRDGMQTVSSMQLGGQVHQIQAKVPKPDQHFQIVSLQQQQSLQQPQQQIQQLSVQPLTQHTSSHQLTQPSQSSQLQQLLQQQQQKKLQQQQHRTTKQGSKVSNAGHQSHLLVSATPAPTLGSAVARSAQPSQPSPSAVSRSLCGSKSNSQPSTQLHTPVNSGTELLRTVQPTHPATASVNAQMAVVEISGQPAAAPLHVAQESPIDFSGGSRNKIVTSTTSSAILPQVQLSCFLCGEKGELICCNNIVYCSASCQVQDWSRHETECSNKQLEIRT